MTSYEIKKLLDEYAKGKFVGMLQEETSCEYFEGGGRQDAARRPLTGAAFFAVGFRQTTKSGKG